jgi:hypothetical protein
MYETLAAGAADRTLTTQDLNIPGPPKGADPQMAAGFAPGSAALAASPNARAAAPVAVGIPGPAGFMPLPLASGQWSVVSGQWSVVSGQWSVVSGQWLAASVKTISQAGPETTLALQGPNLDSGRELSLTGPDAGEVLDSALADLVKGADRSHGEEADGNGGVQGLPGAGDVEDGTAPERIPPDRIDPAGYARPVELPLRIRLVERGLIRIGPISDVVLDGLAAAVAGSPARLAVPADPIARPESPPEPGKGLTKLAVTLVVAGSWCHRARFPGVTSRPAGRPRYRKDPE